MTATYRTSVELDELRQAQTELERHLLSGPNGRCLTCGQFEPCYARTRAAATFRRYGQLPKRRPGRTSRHLIHGNRLLPARYEILVHLERPHHTGPIRAGPARGGGAAGTGAHAPQAAVRPWRGGVR